MAITATDQTKRIVDTHSTEDVAKQVHSLLHALKTASTINEKKKIRRQLRTRDYYLSRSHTASTVATMATKAPATEAKALTKGKKAKAK